MKLWKVLYWDKYWDAMRGLSGYERDMAEQKWLDTHKPPTPQELTAYIQQTYEPGQFQPDEIMEAIKRPTESVESRQEPQTENEQMSQKMDILAMAGPNKKKLQKEYERLGGWWSDISTFYNTGIHHSDRGSQYCCHEYVKLATAGGLT